LRELFVIFKHTVTGSGMGRKQYGVRRVRFGRYVGWVRFLSAKGRERRSGVAQI